MRKYIKLYLNLLITIMLFFSIFEIAAQNSSQNYIVTTVPYLAVTDPTSLTDNNSNSNSNSIIQYFDGLGRPVQTVQKTITPSGADLVSGIEYDGFGRDYRNWIPREVGGNSGAYASDFTSDVNSKLYTTTEYEPSPLNRVTGQYGAGSEWYSAGKKKAIGYTINGSNVKHFYVDGNHIKCDGSYVGATLYGQKITDEDGKTTEQFTDNLGRKVLSRMAGDHDTYYVYDDLDNLRYVLPPLAADAMGTNTNGFDESANSTLGLYGYIYHYDGRKRCTEKKLPGCDWIYMVYDLADRLILSQDGNQRLKTQWTANSYEIFGRLLYSGVIASSNNRSAMESSYSNSVTNESYSGNGPVAGYTNSNFPLASVLIVNYYDNYGFLTYSGNNAGGMLSPVTLSGYDTPDLTYSKTLLTGARIYHLDNSGLSEVNAIYYDKYGRVVQTRASNHLGGYDITYNHLNFKGKVLKTLKEHNISGQPVIPEIYRYAYDKAERLITTRYKLGTSDTITLATNSYDELGRLTTKLRHNNTDNEQFEYNVRNWSTKIKSGAFEENLYYNTNPANSTACFNGNISYSTWNYNSITKGYIYYYDELNRFSYALGTNSAHEWMGENAEGFSYDKQGNILVLDRIENGGFIDQISYTYNGNQFKSAYDNSGSQNVYDLKEYNDLNTTSDDFVYDANGNMTTDLDRKIVTIQYNILNLPDLIQFKNGNQIKSSYDANGLKLRTDYFTCLTNITPIEETKVCNWDYLPNVVDQSGTVYVDNKEYSIGKEYINVAGNLFVYVDKFKMDKVYNSEGYVSGAIIPDLNNYRNGIQYNYYRKDHLGNNREVWQAPYYKYSGLVPGGTIQCTQYYPSGLPWASNVGDNPGLQNRKYNGKEFIEMHGYNTYDYGARGYYPAIGRFSSVDPLAEKHYSVSPYAYCSGNPVNRIDPDGKIDYIVNKDGYFRQANPIRDWFKNLIGKNDKNDRIILEGSKMVISSLPAGSIGKIHFNDNHATGFEIKDSKIAEQTFKDLARNKGVEWARINHSTSKETSNTIINQHNDQIVSVAANVALNYQNKSQQTINLLEHSHIIPNDYLKIPTFNVDLSPSADDISTAKDLPNTTQRVLNVITNEYIYYDKNGIKNTESAGK